MSLRPPTTLARQVQQRREIVLRSAGAADAAALRQLAELADRPLPAGPILLAASDGDVVAALSSRTGELVTDPFRASADLVQLLELRARQLRRLAA